MNFDVVSKLPLYFGQFALNDCGRIRGKEKGAGAIQFGTVGEVCLAAQALSR